MTGAGIIIVGATGTGKSHTGKILAGRAARQGLDLIAFDPLYELRHPDAETNFPGAFPVDDFDTIVETAGECTNACFMIDEAAMVLDHNNIPLKLITAMSPKRHTKRTFIFMFHSYRQVPVKLITYCDYFFLKKTTDSVNLVNRKFSNELITQAYNDCYESNNIQCTSIVNLLHRTYKFIE